MEDIKVKEVQQWLNDTFPSYFRYDKTGKNNGSFPIEPDGYTGARTVKALVMAVQIYYKLTPVDGTWGNATSTICPVIKEGVTDKTIIRIAQGGFYCKGYNPGGFDGGFGLKLAAAIRKYKDDLGINADERMEQDVFKSLLTTDPTVLASGGHDEIRMVQRFLNRNYYNLYKAKLGYISTGGIYDRKTSKALIYAMQKVIGTTADGALGPNTFKQMPSIEEGCSDKAVVNILQAAMICNNNYVSLDGIYSSSLTRNIKDFQKFMCLDIDSSVELGKVNRRTWGALLWSKGDTDRTPNACDCRTKILDPNIAVELYNKGFRYIGRYLTNVEPNGYDKKMSPEEVKILLNAGLKIYPIFQESYHSPVLPTDFTYERGKRDAERSVNASLNLGLEKNTIIYFAIDCDMMEDEIKEYAISYFKGVKEIFNAYNYYNIGVYGARNTCNMICTANYAMSSFVADMSTGYSGNLGYVIPYNWAFEQYIEHKNYNISGHTFDLDYDMASGLDDGVSSTDIGFNFSTYQPPYIPKTDEVALIKPIKELIPAIHWLEEIYYAYHGIISPDSIQVRNCFMAVLDYLYQYMYNEYKWEFISPKDTEFINMINSRYADNENIKALYPYIYAVETGEGNSKITTRAKLVTDGALGVFELPHLAVVIKCYIKSTTPDAWSAWAGDFATAVQEIYVNKQENIHEYIPFGVERLGSMEADTVTVNEARLFNYCDLIADIDGYKIERMLASNLSIYGLSESIEAYYNHSEKYYKRYQYFKSIIGFNKWNVVDIRDTIFAYFNSEWNVILKKVFAKEVDKWPGSSEAALAVLAMNIMYWAKYTNAL